MELRADHVYVLPADAVLTLSGNSLQLRDLGSGPRERNPIDIFFASLAKEAGERAVGVVLSGAGSDGTLGIKSIREQGGLTIAQGHNHSGPRYESMPASAIASGLVDMVLPVEQIGGKLLEYVRSFGTLHAMAADSAQLLQRADVTAAIREIFAILRKRVGHDFEHYKEKTLLRRVHRRMQVLQTQSLADYVDLLRQEGSEAGPLFRDLLIGVTSFFRDAESFEAVARKVIPSLFEKAGAADVVRVWVPGCSTGEEAYSIAILLREHMDTLPVVPNVQVFATDIDDAALAVARAGRYPAQLLGDISPRRRERFFRAEPASCVLTKEVRDLCIFSAHSVIRDPPFSRMDFISCRNLLIYFSGDLQHNVLPLFHYCRPSIRNSPRRSTNYIAATRI